MALGDDGSRAIMWWTPQAWTILMNK